LVSGREAADVANTANAALLAGIVATICYAMMRVAAADLFPVAPSSRRLRTYPPRPLRRRIRAPRINGWSMH